MRAGAAGDGTVASFLGKGCLGGLGELAHFALASRQVRVVGEIGDHTLCFHKS